MAFYFGVFTPGHISENQVVGIFKDDTRYDGCGHHRFTVSAIGQALTIQIMDPNIDCYRYHLREIRFENFWKKSSPNGWNFAALTYDFNAKTLTAYDENGVFDTVNNVEISGLKTELIDLGVSEREGSIHYMPYDMSLSCISVYGTVLFPNEIENIKCSCKKGLNK